MSLPLETNFHAIMNQPFALHSVAEAHFCQKVHGALLQHAGPYPLLAMLPTSSLDYDRMNTLSVQQVRQDKPRGPRTYNPNLCAYFHCFFGCGFLCAAFLRCIENFSMTSRGTGLPSIFSGSPAEIAAQTLVSRHSTPRTPRLNNLWRTWKLLRPHFVLPIHYNTFPPIVQDADTWAARVKSETPAQPIILQPGEWFDIPKK